MSRSVHLVDGTFELFRCFHGAPSARTSSGREVGACRGYLHTMISLLKREDVDDVAVAFDALPSPRGPIDQSPSAQVRAQAPTAFAITRALGIPLWPMVRYQADDGLATAAAKLDADTTYQRIVVCTSDTDLFQTIRDDKVVVWNRITDAVTDRSAFQDRYQIEPGQFPDYIALVGFPSKGIPGVAGLGPKAAAQLLATFPTIDDIPADPDTWPKIRNRDKIAHALAGQRDEVQLVKALTTLATDLPIDCTPAAIRWRGLDEDALDALIDEIEAADVRERLERWER